MKTAIEFWQKAQDSRITLLVESYEGPWVHGVLAEALDETRFEWDRPESAIVLVIRHITDVFTGSLTSRPVRDEVDEVLMVDFSAQQVTNITDNYSGGSFRKWTKWYGVRA